MNKHHIKMALAALAGVITVFTSTSCTRQEENKAPVNLTALQYEIENQSIDFENLWFFNEIEKKTGVHVTFDEVKDPDWTTRVSLMFISGNYADMILRGSLDTEDYGVNQHLLLPLDELIDNYMPNYSEKLTSDDKGKALVDSDGKMYSIGFLISQGINTRGHFFINRQWLDKLNLPVPETIDQLTDTLRAFRDDDPNGNGIHDEIPYQATFGDCNTNTGLYNAFSAFGVPMNMFYVHLKNGKVMFAPEEEGFRECAEWLNQLYTEKLLDIECITQDSNLWAAKVNSNTCGFFTYWRLGNSALKEDIAAQFQCILPPHAEGFAPSLAREEDIVEFGAALTCQNKHPEDSARWLDSQFETETMLVSQNGRVGDTLIIGDDGKYQVNYVPEGDKLYETVPVICGQFYAPEEYYNSVYVPAPHRVEKKSYCDYYEDNDVLEDTPFTLLVNVIPKTVEESVRLQQLIIPLRNTVNSALVEFITKGVTDERYEAFLRDLKAAGMDEYVEVYQTAYDRYEAREQGKGTSDQ